MMRTKKMTMVPTIVKIIKPQVNQPRRRTSRGHHVDHHLLLREDHLVLREDRWGALSRPEASAGRQVGPHEDHLVLHVDQWRVRSPPVVLVDHHVDLRLVLHADRWRVRSQQVGLVDHHTQNHRPLEAPALRVDQSRVRSLLVDLGGHRKDFRRFLRARHGDRWRVRFLPEAWADRHVDSRRLLQARHGDRWRAHSPQVGLVGHHVQSLRRLDLLALHVDHSRVRFLLVALADRHVDPCRLL